MSARAPFVRNRRLVLRGIAGTIVGLPFLPSLPGIGARSAQAAVKKRLVIWFQPDGTMEAKKYGSEPWWPSGSTTSFTLAEHTKPLEAIKSDLVFIQGIDNKSSNLKAYDSVHGTLLRHMLTGGGDTSIDQVIADKIGGDTRFKSIEFGIVPERNGRNDTRISYRSGNPLSPEGDPRAIYKRLFSIDPPKTNGGGGGAGTGGGGDPGGSGGTGGGTDPIDPGGSGGGGIDATDKALAHLHLKRKSVLDAVVGELAAIKSRLNDEDRRRLDDHTTAIRETEKRVVDMTLLPSDNGPQTQALTDGAGFSCKAPAVDMRGLSDNGKWSETAPHMDKIAAIQHDLLMLAFRCDFTRVATFMFMKGRDDTQTYEFLNQKDKLGQHVLAHAWANAEKAPNGKSDYAQIHTWRAKAFKDLVDLMKATPDESGSSMFDSTLLAWVSEMGDGQHNIANLPWIFTGRAGGTLEGGRLMRYSSQPHTNALISMAKLMGVSLPSFGLDGKSPLSGL